MQAGSVCQSLKNYLIHDASWMLSPQARDIRPRVRCAMPLAPHRQGPTQSESALNTLWGPAWWRSRSGGQDSGWQRGPRSCPSFRPLGRPRSSPGTEKGEKNRELRFLLSSYQWHWLGQVMVMVWLHPAPIPQFPVVAFPVLVTSLEEVKSLGALSLVVPCSLTMWLPETRPEKCQHQWLCQGGLRETSQSPQR